VEVVEDTPEAVRIRREKEQAALAAKEAANQGQTGNETATTTSKTTVVKQTNPNQNTNK